MPLVNKKITTLLRYFLNGLIAALTLSYPFLIWFSLDYFQPRVLALILAGLFLIRFLLQKNNAGGSRISRLIMPGCVLFLLVIAWLNQAAWLLLYPVFVSLLFFCIFAGSLIYPPTVVERLARLDDPELPETGIIYTRKVTQVWSVFFLSNAAVSLFTVWYGDYGLWSLYNGCIFYILMGLLMAIEMTIRRKVRASY